MRLIRMAVVVAMFAIFVAPASAPAQQAGPGMYRGMPYGQFCPGRGWGPYGVRKPVRTVDEAKQVIDSYFSALGQTMRAGAVEERRWYFEVEILERDGTVVDKAAVDKRNGRIRSMY